jgi:hypothetical protein
MERQEKIAKQDLSHRDRQAKRVKQVLNHRDRQAKRVKQVLLSHRDRQAKRVKQVVSHADKMTKKQRASGEREKCSFLICKKSIFGWRGSKIVSCTGLFLTIKILHEKLLWI